MINQLFSKALFSSTIFKPAVLTIPMLGDIVPSCVFDKDVTIEASYDGTAQKWLNYESTPADGSAQTDYDFYLGADGSTSTDDPTFTGAAGSSDAYWALDGGDFFQIVGGNTTLIDAFHHSATKFTYVMAIRTSSSTNLSHYSMSTNRDLGVEGVGMAVKSVTGSGVQAFITSISNPTRTRVIQNSIEDMRSKNYVISFVFDNVAETADVYQNKTHIGQVSLSLVNSSGTGNDIARVFGMIGNSFPASARGYASSLFNDALDSTEIGLIVDEYESRHGRSYA